MNRKRNIIHIGNKSATYMTHRTNQTRHKGQTPMSLWNQTICYIISRPTSFSRNKQHQLEVDF